MSCHAITAIDDTYGTGNYTLVDPPRYPFAFSEAGLLKAINHQLIKAKPAFHKKTLLKPLHRSAEFCSTCHKTHIPESVNHYRWLRAQNHYDSFLQSGVSGHRVDSFYYPDRAVPRCSACHMPLQALDDPAARDFDDSGTRHVHSHQFPGANTGVAHMVGLPESVIDGESGLLVPPEDVAALTGAIATLMNDDDRRAAFGRAGKARMRTEFSIATLVDRHVELYGSILT